MVAAARNIGNWLPVAAPSPGQADIDSLGVFVKKKDHELSVSGLSDPRGNDTFKKLAVDWRAEDIGREKCDPSKRVTIRNNPSLLTWGSTTSPGDNDRNMFI